MTLISESKARLAAGMAALRASWQAQSDSAALLTGRARLVDTVLADLWRQLALPPELALIAVGGYGAGELYPASDVDLLILTPPHNCAAAHEPHLAQFIGLMWDIGLEIGHSVRDIDACLTLAAEDISAQTALLEARLICGDDALFAEFSTRFCAALNASVFCRAKLLEQQDRHSRYNDTPYNLEPNCKEHPGALRDLQVLRWVARAAGIKLASLMSADEYEQYLRAGEYLARLRCCLHFLARRREDRLLFEHQEALAAALGVAPQPPRRASEMLMQGYYRNAKLVMQLNAIVLEHLLAQLSGPQQPSPIIIDAHFQMVRERLDIRDEKVFQRAPRALLEAFLLLQRRSELKGMTARTLRALWAARGLIDATFRQTPENRALFLSLFQQKHLVHALRQMNQYDILGQYLPAFGQIVGQMQHDLFHVYTVDIHILQVIRNLRRFTMPEFAHEYAFCSRLMANFERPWLLYIAALFHDIAKGRGGDHSRLGVADAQSFCQEHQIEAADSALICFLVEQHLTLSATAQKLDIHDPAVVRSFAALVGDERHLTALYLLTVCDIRGTSPKVWNAWKGKLLEDLYRLTLRVLQGDAQVPDNALQERQSEALKLLRLRGLTADAPAALWAQLDSIYFMRHDADEIAWHTRNLYYRFDRSEAIVKTRLNPAGVGLQVMVYAPDQPLLFARLCGFFARQGYSIADAKIHTSKNAHALDSFVLLDAVEHPPYRDMIGFIEHELAALLSARQTADITANSAAPAMRLSRQARHFPIQPEVLIRADERGQHHALSLVAADRPGLLFAIARCLAAHEVTVSSAKIATLGERVEDSFLVSGAALTHDAARLKLEQELVEVLSTGDSRG